MSLINDALKKAQHQRTGEAPPLGNMPTIGGEPASRIASGAKSGGSTGLFIKIGAVVATVAVMAGVVIFLGRSHEKPSSPPPTAPAAVAAPAPAVSVANAPVAEPAVTPTAFVLPIAPPPAATPEVVAPKAEPKPIQPVAVETPAAVAADKPAPVTGKLDSNSIKYIEGLHVAGIRASGSDSKVLMNDRVYRIGDIVEHDLELKLVGITASSLTFENDSGVRYTRNF